jgi:hypothetical protein
VWEAGIGPCERVTVSTVEQCLTRRISFSTIGRSRMAVFLLAMLAIPTGAAQVSVPSAAPSTPPRVAQARRFLQHRGWSGQRDQRTMFVRPIASSLKPLATPASTAVWQPLGPTGVMTPNYGVVTGRVSSIAIDPADVTGNRVYVGTTGGGVWASQNAASSGEVIFNPLTDASSPFDSLRYGSISIGAVTVQPGGTGVVLAGTGDPNDALDSYYGAGILRSVDNGQTWSAIASTSDHIYSFLGEGFSGFAWSTTNPQLVVAAVSQAYEGTLVNAPFQNTSYAGLYYSTDAGATWTLASITDGPGKNVQGPSDSFDLPHGNSATAVIWNPVRQMFVAAVRFHGYYQSIDGITWNRMIAQPGATLTARMCPANPETLGSIACPIFRGALAVNPVSGDTFAWTVDLYNQDQGLWQDVCAISGGSCSNESMVFSQRLSTVPLQTNTIMGPVTIANGDYNLVLAAIPSAQDTLLFAGANDLWRCSLAMDCSWRNTTNANTCMSAHVAPYQHALTWNPANPQEILIGNDSGLWRSMDAIDETGSACSPDDPTHFRNLNAGLGSLAEVESISQIGNSPYTMMAGLGVNGTAGVKSTSGPTNTWPQILGGEGGPVAIDPTTPTNWYVNSGAGVSIHRCSDSEECTPDLFGAQAVIDNADVSGDGFTMTSPAPFIIDPLDPSQILLGTCRLWRGPADGTGWTRANAIGAFLDGVSGNTYCSGDALIRSIAAMPIAGGGEVIYAGMFGSLNGGAIFGGHILKTTFNPGSSSQPGWTDLTFNPVVISQPRFNQYGFDISSIFIDPHDPSGNTVYVTIAGILDSYHAICTIYRTIDGGLHWYEINSNLRGSPANSVVIDPQDADTAYVATDAGVYSTRQVSTCIDGPSKCWSTFGTGLPYSPVTQLSAASSGSSLKVLVAGTYGRGIFQVPLWTADTVLTHASVDPNSLIFASQAAGTASPAQTLTLTNDGGIALQVTSISADAPFSESDSCVGRAVNEGASCTIQVAFAPDQVGPTTGELRITTNVSGGLIIVSLAGTGAAAGPVKVSPSTLDFGQVAIGKTSVLLPLTVENTTANTVALRNIATTLPFSVAGNPCGASLAANSACALSVAFTPTEPGQATGNLSIVDDVGTQTILLKGTGAVAATDTLSKSSIVFSSTSVGQQSRPEVITLSNAGDLPLDLISAVASRGFRSSDTCAGSLGAHANCAFSVVFAPDAVGAVEGTLTVADAMRTQTIALSGTGLEAPAFQVSSSQIEFGAVSVGQTSTPIALTVTNTGGASISNVGFQISGMAESSFSWTATTCGTSLIIGGSCSIQLSFAPVQAGQLTATLVVSSSTLGVLPLQVRLSGVGQGNSSIIISPSQMSFLQPKLGQSTAAQSATISNTTNLIASGLTIATSNSFSLSQNTCGSTLGPGSSCSIGVIFTPTSNGVANGTLVVSSVTLPGAATAVLVGIGGAAGSLQVQPGALAFPLTGVGLTSTPILVTLINNGTVAISDLELSTSTGFQVSLSTCGASLEVAATCTAQIAFAPGNAGQQMGTLSIASGSLTIPVQIALSGMGFDFTVGVSGQSSKTVSSGQTAQYTLALTPLNGSTGTFTFACGSLPTNSSCSFNPGSESVPANATGTVIFSIATGGSRSSASLVDSRNARYDMLPLICLIAIPIAFGSKRGKQWLAILLMTGLIGIAGCAGAGGGGGGTPASPGGSTPAGTYSIVVTATASGVSHKTSLTLIVD